MGNFLPKCYYCGRKTPISIKKQVKDLENLIYKSNPNCKIICTKTVIVCHRNSCQKEEKMN